MSNKTWMERLDKSDRAAFDAAEKIPQAEWKGAALCVPPGDDNSLFFSSLARLEERYGDGDYPAFAWDCDPKPFTLGRYDAHNMVEAELVDHHEDAIDAITTAQWDELTAFLEGWSERTGIVSWEPNMKRAVLLTPPVLRVWTCCDEEWVIAYSAEDAALVYAETGAEPMDEPWTACPDDKLFTYRDEDENGQPRHTRKTMREHAAERGRGYFGSANV